MSKDRSALALIKRNEILRLGFLVLVLLAVSYGTWTGLKIGLNTEYPVLVVVSGSMVPTLNQGDIILIHGVDPATIGQRTIIVFHSPRDYRTLIVHRVGEVVRSNEGIFFVTKGDNNPVQDNWNPEPGVPSKYVVGSFIAKIPYVGFVVMKMREPLGIAIIILVMAAVILLEISDRGKKRRVRPQPP